MNTATAKKEINWLFPNEGQVVTVDDFRAMVKEAERGPSMSFAEYKKTMDLWWQNHL